ncbi:alkylated DNA repair protein alkB homolog 8 isoform X3 [Zingiber officinale]|uniref:Fe2OG dioxygenase domain-containing protein n=1 Tax=Zingiber officinale TaxID=94328 RepID=A0A8J5H9M0_ZINOF|nr:alkylated DNA repair protein alkB homolog 8 isoform X3 [Zingiber officinale]KAG6512580.1 hypothetical protein ZIOFF_030705 [Zingiber officinale]
MEGGDEIRRRALEEAFGESSDDDGAGGGEEEEESDPSSSACSLLLEERCGRPLKWEMVDGVKGLWLCRDFLSAAQQSSLLSAIQHEGWFDDGCHNQAMRFGDLPGWATKLSRLVCEAVWFSEVSPAADTESIVGDQYGEDCWPLPLDLLQREPLFDQLIANVYYPGEGICAHVDLMRFDDGIAIISLESACVMHFTQCKQEDNINKSQTEEGIKRIPVFLNAGSVVLMSGEARYLWKHEINRKQGFQLWEGRELAQQRRTSVTLRKLCKSHN